VTVGPGQTPPGKKMEKIENKKALGPLRKKSGEFNKGKGGIQSLGGEGARRSQPTEEKKGG